ncbi:MAG: hypothetical protein BroJett018_02860 [Chloroflexota bacterium]|nr:hypothetical protein [Chloroflexota bacterium]NOG61920.1 hypothetical protein [Chloroflexota bacterium]GIK62492.1 MAG: hypothetical protein BroJett018_02860 [Chloroflexota bacterium]
MLYKFIRPLILALVALGLLNTPHMIGLAQDDGLSRQEQAALREILAAYERTRNWNTYSAQSGENSQLALSLAVGDADPYTLNDNTRRTVDSVYDVPNSAVQTELGQTRTIRELEGRQTINNVTVQADFQIVGISGIVYVQGDRISSPDDGRNLELNDFTPINAAVTADLASAEVANLESHVDAKELIALRATNELLETATAVEDLGEVTLRQYPNPVQVYTITVDPLVGIEVLDIDVESILANPHLANLDRAAFFDHLATDSSLTITVFLDAEDGGLVGEQLVLEVEISLSETDGLNVTRGTSAEFTLALSFESSVLYFAINEAVTINDPGAAR